MRPLLCGHFFATVFAIALPLTSGCRTNTDSETDATTADAADTTLDASRDTPDPEDGGADSGDTAPNAADGTADIPPDTADTADTGPTLRPLVSNAAWTRLEAAEDPLAGHRPSAVDCAESATTLETLNDTQTFTVDTSRCNYIAAHQSLLSDIEAGNRLRMRLWHFQLTAPDPTRAHAALLVDGEVVWEEQVTIPADSQLFRPEWEAAKDYAAGTEVVFHLHNHGANTWNFIEFVQLVE